MTFAFTILYGWPLVVIILFGLYSKTVAVIASIFAGYLLLPEWLSLDLPALPALNKNSIPALAVFLAVLFAGADKAGVFQKGWIPRGFSVRLMLVSLVIGAFLTTSQNGDVLVYGPTFIASMRTWDTFSTILSTFIQLLPLLIGWKMLARPEYQRLVLVALTVAGMCYSFLALYEVRMSPQLNNMVYGFFPHSWLQHIRGDGYRPLVFLQHGLWLSMFFAMCVLATFGNMRRSTGNQKYYYLGMGLWLLFTLILSKSLGALMITLILLPIVVFSRARIQLITAVVMASVIISYPMLRGADLVPVDRVMEWAESVSTERAESLQFRLNNEDRLLNKARERPVFGWGGWGRSFVFNEEGIDISVVDGYWVGVIGLGGWARYLGEFGLLCLPAALAFMYHRRYQFEPAFFTLLIILIANLIDLLPNATITPLTWLIAGSLLGRIELGRSAETTDINPDKTTARQALSYTRQGRFEDTSARTNTRTAPSRHMVRRT